MNIAAPPVPVPLHFEATCINFCSSLSMSAAKGRSAILQNGNEGGRGSRWAARTLFAFGVLQMELSRPLYARKHPPVVVAWRIPMTRAVQKWMKLSGRLKADHWESTVDLYSSWRDWCRTQKNMSPEGPARFAEVIGRTLVRQRTRQHRGFRGYQLRRPR